MPRIEYVTADEAKRLFRAVLVIELLIAELIADLEAIHAFG